MEYILVDVPGLGRMYQEVLRGSVQRYVSEDGAQSMAVLPTGVGAVVVDANPARPAWGLPDPAAEAPAPEPAHRMVTKNQFIDRLGDAAYVAILAMARQSVQVEAFVKRLEMATPDANGNSVDLLDTRTIAGVQALEPLLVAQGVVAEGWADGVLNA